MKKDAVLSSGAHLVDGRAQPSRLRDHHFVAAPEVHAADIGKSCQNLIKAMQLRAIRTLRGRLALAAAGTIVAAIAAFAVVTVVVVRHELHSTLDQALRTRAEQVGQLAVSAPAVLTSPGALESPVSGRQIVVEVIDAHGRVIARSLTLGAQLLPQDRLARAALSRGTPGYENLRIGRRQFRLYAAPIARAGGPAAGGVVLVASDTTDIARTVNHLGFVLALIGAGLALAAAALAAVLSRRGLRPVGQLAAAAGEIERTADASRRLPETTVADEVGQLTGVLNRMLSALERARAGERRFLADASHELRTPVTTLLGNVDYASRHGMDDELLAELRAGAARLARLVDDLLVLERADDAATPMVRVPLADVVRGVVQARHAADGRVAIGRLDRVYVRGDEEALGRALENLVENALVHGPLQGEVTVTLHAIDSYARLTVTDEGSGPDPAERERVFERFWRGRDAEQRPGSGLGLSIVAAIARRHSGRVLVDGSAFTLQLPLAR
jgi:signal transduction histidine kinase